MNTLLIHKEINCYPFKKHGFILMYSRKKKPMNLIKIILTNKQKCIIEHSRFTYELLSNFKKSLSWNHISNILNHLLTCNAKLLHTNFKFLHKVPWPLLYLSLNKTVSEDSFWKDPTIIPLSFFLKTKTATKSIKEIKTWEKTKVVAMDDWKKKTTQKTM